MFKKLKTETINSFIGRPFFYVDKEVGIGWESRIDSMQVNQFSDSYTLELSCGTLIKLDRLKLLEFRNSAKLTNMEN